MDALRWVMGEQSVKQLRGKAMEDVIFAGSSGKSPLNIAEVSLTLINDNGSVPESLREFSEIMLTRRLYRSGESVYFINKQPCRLKDIHQVFMGSGMGAKSYALIQQGNIGAITEASPDERRWYIEEAAGTTRFKASKIEALRKLDSTRQNLLRLMDIITEIVRQMKSLERQVQKAETYRKYQKKIRKFDILLSLHQYDQFQLKIQQQEMLLKMLNDQDTAHQSQLSLLESAVAAIKFNHLQLNQKISDRQSKKHEYALQTDRLENDLDHLNKDISRLTTELDALETVRHELEEKAHQITLEITENESQQQAIQNEIHGMSSVLDAEKSNSSQTQSQLATLEKDRDDATAHLMDLKAQEARYQHMQQNASSSRDSLQRRLKRLDEAVFTASREVAQAEKNESDAKTAYVLAKDEVARLTERIEHQKKLLLAASQALGQQVKLTQHKELDKARVTSKYGALKKMADNFEWYQEGVRSIMKRIKQPPETSHASSDLSGILCLIADILDPEPSYEAALDAALGESLQYFLVNTPDTGLQAISFLQSQNSGRCGFIPVSLCGNRSPDTPSAESPVDHLLNHIHVKSGYESVSNMLLGHVLLSEKLSDAVLYQDSLQGEQFIVTLDGQKISSQGILIGGTAGNSSGILAKKKELMDLKTELEGITIDLESEKKNQASLEFSVRNMESSLQKLIEQKNDEVHEEIQSEKNWFRAGETLKQSRQLLERTRMEQEDLTSEEMNAGEELSRNQAALVRIQQNIETVQNRIFDISAAIVQASREMESVHQRWLELQLQLTTYQTQFDHIQVTLKRLTDFRQDGLQRLSQIQKDIAVKQQKLSECIQISGEKRQSLDRLYAESRIIEQDLDIDHNVFADMERQMTDSDIKIKHIQQLREKMIQQLRQLDLEISQLTFKKDSTLDRLMNNYHKPLQEIRKEAAAFTDIDEKLSESDMENELDQFRSKIAKIGDVNFEAIAEYEALKSRFDFLETQRQDMEKAIDDLHKLIQKINRTTQDLFLETFHAINEKIQDVFPRLFEGGIARLVLTEPDKPLETGVEFLIQPPGKKLTRISLLSGGEKALSAIAFIFSIFLIKPAAFCLMDEIDAPLDESNVFRFNRLLQLIGEKSQIVMITHNKHSMEFADTLMGITMEQKGVSKVVSVNLEKYSPATAPS